MAKLSFGMFVTIWSLGFANVTSTSGSIKFDINGDGSSEAKLDLTGLAIGKNLDASANLHVGGNAVVTSQFTIGQSTLGSSNLKISGSM
jgi:hypothetical protein